MAVDGKAQRGRLRYQAGGSPVHALTAFCHKHGVVLAQEAIECGAGKAEAEPTVAPALLARVDWPGRVLTGDALFCQRKLCQQVVRAGGDYLLLVRENQPTLHRDRALLFDPPADLPAPLPLLDRREAVTVEKGRGRTHDRRHLVAPTDLTGYLDWPGIAQVFRLERTWREGGTWHRHLHYGITSLPPAVADAARLLALKRGHWRIEKRVQYVHDVTFGEAAGHARVGKAPHALAAPRKLLLARLRAPGWARIADAVRHYGAYAARALALLGKPARRR